MDIVFLDFDDIRNPLLAAGQAIATLQVGRLLVQKGHKVSVISSRYPGYKDRMENGIRYVHIGLGCKNIRLNNIFYILSVPFAIRKIKADVIVECFTAPISTLFTPLLTSIPVIALPSSFDAKRFSQKYHLPFELIEKIGCRFYSYFLPYTNYMDQKMKKVNPGILSRVVPEGVGEEFFFIKRKSPKHILFLGRLDINQKGIDLLLHAYAKVADAIDYPLIIAGNGPDEKQVQMLIKVLHLEKKVSMVGSMYGTKKMEMLAESLFVTFPSRDEGFSCFALEALASGLPLLAFNIPGLSWLNDQCSVRVKPFDIDAYAHALKEFTKKNNLDELSKKARDFAGKFSWESVCDQFEAFFEEIIILNSRQISYENA